MTMLAIDRVSKTYPNGTEALQGVSLQVDQGEFVALVGGSGCGKSTLLRLIAGLESATAGSVLLADQRVQQPTAQVGLIFQEPRLLPWLTVAQNIGFGIAHLPAAQRTERVQALLEEIHLPGYGKRWPKELSGGQAQRVALARALAPQPDVLLLDEPFSALDAFTRAELQAHLIALWQQHQRTFVIVTHDIEEAITLADRIVIMRPNPGRIGVELRVPLPRPRVRGSAAYDAVARDIRRALHATIVGEPLDDYSSNNAAPLTLVA